jgi:hypothetical protein
MPNPRSQVPLLLRSLAVLVVCGAGFLGCAWFRGAINSSPQIRWWLFSTYGAERLCPEMLKRGAPLTLTSGGPTVGRFFPSACVHSVDNVAQTVSVQFAGSGYAWTPLAGRAGFECQVSVEYRPDFYLDDDAMYVWGRLNRILTQPVFRLLSVENRLVDWAAQGPGAYLAATFGQQIVNSRLSQGFTVVRSHEGDEFALGLLAPPERPPRPFEVSGGDRLVLANQVTEVRSGQVDFIGPLEVIDAEHFTFFRWRLLGQRAEAFVFPRSTADAWRDGLQRGVALGPAPGPHITNFPLEPGEHQTALRLPPGQYVIVIDNSAVVGSVSPPWNPLASVGSGGTQLSYIVELGEE